MRQKVPKSKVRFRWQLVLPAQGPSVPCFTFTMGSCPTFTMGALWAPITATAPPHANRPLLQLKKCAHDQLQVCSKCCTSRANAAELQILFLHHEPYSTSVQSSELHQQYWCWVSLLSGWMGSCLDTTFPQLPQQEGNMTRGEERHEHKHR